MNDEQICGFYLRAKEANLTLEKINETLKQFATNFVCFHVDREREVNVVESLLDVENTLKAIDDKICETNDKIEETNEHLETIGNYLSGIRHALNRIADSLENHGTLTLELKSDPSDGPFCSSEEDDEDVDEGEYK